MNSKEVLENLLFSIEERILIADESLRLLGIMKTNPNKDTNFLDELKNDIFNAFKRYNSDLYNIFNQYKIAVEKLDDEIIQPNTAKSKPSENFISKKLSLKQQASILGGLFGMFMEGKCIYYESGEEFHGYSSNDAFDLTTLEGIFKYQKHLAFETGQDKIKFEFKKLLGI